MANILVYWTWDNYQADLRFGAGFNFNSRQPRLHQAVEIGDTVWAVTSRRLGDGREGVFIVQRLLVKAKTFNSPGYKYGKYRVWGDIPKSSYYAARDEDNADRIVRALRFSSDRQLGRADSRLVSTSRPSANLPLRTNSYSLNLL